MATAETKSQYINYLVAKYIVRQDNIDYSTLVCNNYVASYTTPSEKVNANNLATPVNFTTPYYPK